MTLANLLRALFSGRKLMKLMSRVG